jgi:hypothetical protein
VSAAVGSVRVVHTSFFEAAAQVIPVLFIVLAFELRVFGDIGKKEPERDVAMAFVRLLVFLLIADGEWRALHVLLTGGVQRTDEATVTVTLLAEATTLALIPLLSFLRAAEAGAPARYKPLVGWGARIASGAFGLGLMAAGVLQIVNGLR